MKTENYLRNLATARLWKLEHKEQQKAYNKEYRLKNKSKVKTNNSLWYEKHRKEHIKNVNKYNKERDLGLFAKYLNMQRRCKYKSQYHWQYYIGRGIKIEWKCYKDFKKDMFESYLNHLNKYGHRDTTLDRINSRKNYCKKNCRWATYKIQATRSAHIL